MKARTLFAVALLAATAVSGFAGTFSEEEQRSRLQVLRSANTRKLTPSLLELAYLDTYYLLNEGNQCGNFFGGGRARVVLDELVVSLKPKPFPNSRIGISMSGTFRNIMLPDGNWYRLFERVELNTNGAFYKATSFPTGPVVPRIGSFTPNTREVRVIILLHELAHLIKGADDTWLIPDDGMSPEISRLNTQTIEAKCGKQIRAL